MDKTDWYNAIFWEITHALFIVVMTAFPGEKNVNQQKDNKKKKKALSQSNHLLLLCIH